MKKMEMEIVFYERGQIGNFLEEHRKWAYKFLFYKDKSLIAVSHFREYEEVTHKDLHQKISDVYKISKMPDGAGICRIGKIVSWRSEGLEITTPNPYREIIKESLNMEEKID